MSSLTPRVELLLSEYAQCQAERSNSATRVWQATSVFLAALALAMVILGAVLTTESLPTLQAVFATWAACGGAMFAAFLWGWAVWEEWLDQCVALFRMLEIEVQLELRHQSYRSILRQRPRTVARVPVVALLGVPDLTALDPARLWVPPRPRWFLLPGSTLVALVVIGAAFAFGMITTFWLTGREEDEAIKLCILMMRVAAA